MKLFHQSSRLFVSILLLLLFAFSSQAQVRQSRVRREPPKPPTNAQNTELATAVSELLKLEPLAPRLAADNAANPPHAADQPPADDAPLEELLAFWQKPHYGTQPSEKTRQRLLEAIETRPWLFGELVMNLPENRETVERLYQLYQQSPGEEDKRWKSILHQWLIYHSPYFLDELLQQIQKASAEGGSGFLALDALAQQDWEKAKSLLLARPQDPYVLATLYKNALRAGDEAVAESSRRQLQALVANVNNGEPRLWALQRLLESEWEGQAEWFTGLFADATLTGFSAQPRNARLAGSAAGDNAGAEVQSAQDPRAENYLAVPVTSFAKRLVPLVCQLIGSSKRAIHNAAVDTLVQFLSHKQQESEPVADAARALLPWLTDPAWAEGPQREMLIGALTKLNLPESAPGLLWVLSNDEDSTLRALAGETLGKLKYQPAAPAIRHELEREKDETLRPRLIAALVHCGGLSDEEAAAAIEAFARHLVTPAGAAQINAIRESQDAEPLPLHISIGRVLSDDESLPCPEGLAARLFERVKALRRTQPQVAKEILNIVQGVALPLAYQFLAQRIGEGWVDVAALQLALESAAEMRRHASSELYPLLDRGGAPAGVAAALLADEAILNAVLQGKDAKAQLALLAAARYQRAALPLDLVAALFREKTLAAAGESYLIAEDSAAARRMVWARHAGEALILGEHFPREYVRTYNPAGLIALEEEARRALNASPAIEEIVALYCEDTEKPKLEIRVQPGRAQLRLFANRNTWRERLLSNSELSELQSFLARPELEELKPERPVGGYQEVFYEFLRLGKQGGYRVVLAGINPAPRNNASLHEHLSDLFYRLRENGKYETHYAIEAKLPGVEVLHADDRQPILLVGQENGEVRVLSSEVPEKTANAVIVPAWRVWQQNQLGSRADAPALFRKISDLIEENPLGFYIALGLFRNRQLSSPSQLREMATAFSGSTTARIIEAAAPPANYLSALTTPDGKWVIGQRLDGKAMKLLRYNTETTQEFAVPAEPQKLLFPVSYLPEYGKVLVRNQPKGDWTNGAAHLLLDPASGALQPVQGEFGPLYDQALRTLQPAGKAAEYWVTLYDARRKQARLGRYNARAFTFMPVLDVPELELHSADVWVDEPRGKVWLTYKGHLLRLTLPALGR